MLRIESLHTYPVKSCAALAHDTAHVDARGLAGDRRYMVVDANGRFVTGRERPELVLVAARPRPDGLTLTAPGMDDLDVDTPQGPAVDVRIWRDDTTARRAGPDADAWFSDYLGRDCRLVYQDEEDLRPARTVRGDPSDAPVSFADGYPLLLIGTASLADLNTRLSTPVAMSRFRPNVVVSTQTPYVEDTWRAVRIGGVEFDVIKRCARCIFTTVDPLSGEKHPGGEPLKTLRNYRLDKEARGVMFGVNLIPRGPGTVARAMAVEPVT